MIRNGARVLLVVALITVALPLSTASADPIGDPAFEQTWERTDRPVADGVVNRTWMWGPEGHTEAFMEPYDDAPGGERLVQYFDKTRMEINDPAGDPSSIWHVTNGLLAQELVTGNMQTGDDNFSQREPANVHIAGDANPDSPTYATFNSVLDYEPIPDDWGIIQTIDKAGNVDADSSLGGYGVTAANYVEQTNHTVASVFWEFMNSSGPVSSDGQIVNDNLFENPFFAVGFPITEAYWMHVPVDGEWQDVLAQCFERRCLTYTPGNDAGWQVEAGNIGQHYYQWRHGETPSDPTPDPPADPDTGTRDNPAPMGTSVAFGDGWEVTVLDVIPDATQDVLDENQFNDPPEPGHQFFIAEVRATYHGEGSDRFDGSYRLRTVGDEGVSYSTFSDSCGVIPNDMPDPEVFTGGTISGYVCWEVRSADAGSLVMFDDPISGDADRTYMALFADGSSSPEPPAAPQPPTDQGIGSRGNPIPMGTPVDLGDGWEVTVDDVTADATQSVLDENRFNDPPASGHQFFIARVSATYHGSGSDSFDGSYRLRAVGDQAVSYSTFSDSCGVIPDRLDDPEVFTGGRISGNVCWEIRSADADSLVMFDDPFSSDADRVYVSLH